MPKLLWVMLPLLLALAVAGWQWVRRGPPPRHAVNVWSSLLLLLYVTATAALGIFWVARQQLPVFDWHYLFGYVTVLLLALHLWFNFGAVWRHLTRHKAPTARSPGQAGGRRRMLGAGGAVLASGAAYLLGLHHGRGEPDLRLGGAVDAEAEPPADAALALIERFHAHSSHSRAGVLTQAPPVSWGDAPPPFKHYSASPRVALPPPTSERAWPDLAALGSVLWHVAGVTDRPVQLNLRAAPSSGALFSTELYVIALAVKGLPSGLWHYDARAHALEHLKEGAVAEEASGTAAELADAAAVVVATAVFRRTGRKYRDRTYRYVLADLGHGLENLRVAAEALGAPARLVARFDESRLAALIGVDEAEEGVLAVAALRPPGWSPLAQTASSCAVPALAMRRNPAGREGRAALGVTDIVHRATSLRVSAPVGRPATPGPSADPPVDTVGRPPATAAADRLRVIAARRSVRRFARAPLPRDALDGVLEGMAHPSLLSPAVRIDLVVNAVSGLAPGAYRYDAAHRALLPRRVPMDLRTAARAAALDQDVIGAAAVVFVLSIDRAAFAADACGGARGYRHAFLEAGLVGERIYLEAGVRGLGACAVGAFYDDEASELVGVDPAREWVVHFAALGLPGG